MVYLQYLYTGLSQYKAPQSLLNLKNLKRILKKAHHRYHQQLPLELQKHLMTRLESGGIHQAQACLRVQDHLWKLQVQLRIIRIPQIKTNL